MTGIAEVHIIFAADMIPASATCQICGAEMPNLNRLGDSAKDKIEWFAAQFDIHMREKHFDQFEVRSVRKV
jgi:hypothetical protein